jgi:hypothetical protein
MADVLERAGALAFPALGGVVLMEAVKRLEAPPPGVRAPARALSVVRPLAAARPRQGAPPQEAALSRP